jgi:hypothetical protein
MIQTYLVFLAIVCAVMTEGWRTMRKKANGMPLPPGSCFIPDLASLELQSMQRT